MEVSVSAALEKYNRSHMRRRRILSVIVVLSVVVSCMVPLLLKKPGLTMTGEAYCGYSEHTHSESCIEKRLICTLSQEAQAEETQAEETQEEEVQAEETQAEETSSVQEESESEESASQDIQTDQDEAQGHIHTDDCYEDVYLCGFAPDYSHVHTLQCYSDPEADVETREDWENSIVSAEITGDWGEDLVKIAQTQLGYGESKKNYSVAENRTTLNGITRYGQWFGKPYAQWNALFVAWCMSYAQLPENLLFTSANSGLWLEEVSNESYFRQGNMLTEEYIPQAGDIVFIKNQSDDKAPIMGIVEAVTNEELHDGSGKMSVSVIQGDRDGIVGKTKYAAHSSAILGYIGISQAYNQQLEGTGNKSYNVPVYTDASYTEILGGETVITIIGSLPEGAVPRAYPVNARVQDKLVLMAYDITVYMPDGSIYEPETPLTVNFSSPRLENSQGESISDASAYYIDPNGNSQHIDSFAIRGGVGFRAEHFSTYALAVPEQNVTGTYLRHASSITANKQYVIVSANGGFALSTGNPNNAFLSLKPVPANEGYYYLGNSIDGATVNNAYRWTISGTTTRQARNVGNSRYLTLGSSTSLFATNSASLTFEYSTYTDAWSIKNGNYYLTASTGAFARSNTNNHTKNLNIYEVVNTTLTIPGYIEGTVHSDTGSETEGGAKPDYPPYIDPTGPLSGRVNFTDITNTNVRGNYYSDPSTSQIESLFTDTTADNGKLIADKSVIYGADDYSTNYIYNDGEFSVALSALAQQYRYETVTVADQAPIDLVLIMDFSGSMEQKGGYKMDGSEANRMELAVEAANLLINEIMRSHPENRIGIVCFSRGSAVVLPMGRYYCGNSQNPTWTQQNAGNTPEYLQYTDNSYDTYGLVYTNSNLKTVNSNGSLTSFARRQFLDYGGTYTQSGIARAYEVFAGVQDTDYVLSDTGETVKRDPVTILLSDGEPTFATSNYADVLNGSHYGNGLSGVGQNNNDNCYGILGYYTVLSANYYKHAIATHYGTQSYFYSIGMGIFATGTENSSGEASSSSGDHYKRAVLNPSEANVSALVPAITPSEANDTSSFHNAVMLHDLLGNTYTSANYITVGSDADYNLDNRMLGHQNTASAIGTTNRNLPILNNPFEDYNYADGAYFHDNYNPGVLDAIFQSIIDPFLTRISYVKSFTTGAMEETVDLTDRIGEGFRVTDGFTMRYQGENYLMTLVSDINNVKTYRYLGNATVIPAYSQSPVALNGASVFLTTHQDGTQTVKWEIPAQLIPEYSANSSEEWFYEMLPIRLLFKVGLTPQALAQASAMEEGDEPLVFYTDRWGNSDNAEATFVPKNRYYVGELLVEGNPYYKSSHVLQTTPKTENTTGTENFSFKEYAGSPTDQVVSNPSPWTHILGNNGKIVFNYLSRDSVTDVSVTKRWVDENGDSISAQGTLDDMGSFVSSGYTATMTLYRTALYGSNGSVTEAVSTRVIDGNGSYTWTDLPTSGTVQVGSNTYLCDYVYSVEETASTNPLNDEVNASTETDSKGNTVVINQVSRPQFSSTAATVTITKEWMDSHGNAMTSDFPQSTVTASLYADGFLYDTVTISQANNWVYTADNLPYKWENGDVINWTVSEVAVDGFGTTYIQPVHSTFTTNESRWQQVNTVEDDQKYLLAYGNNVLYLNGTAVGKATVSDISTLSGDTAYAWTGVISNGNYRFRAVYNNTNRYLRGQRTTTTVTVNTTTTAANGNWKLDTNGQLYITSSGRNYYLVYNNNNFTLSTNNANAVRLYRYVESTVTHHRYTVTISNWAGVELPKTGGSGTIMYTMGGSLIFITAAFLLSLKVKPKRKGQSYR